MRLFAFSLAVMAVSPATVWAAFGDQWILGIDHIDNEASFTSYANEGYSGAQSSGYPQYIGKSWYRNGPDGVARVYWQLSGNAIVNGQAIGNPVPATKELYKVEFFGTAAHAGTRDDWQPLEGDFNGSEPGDGEGIIDPAIPWNGTNGTNHQYMGADAKVVGGWKAVGPGPHSPTGTAANAGDGGIYMWLTANSWLYAKWNFGFSIGKSWSAIRLTQATPLTGPVTGDFNNNGVVDAADYVIWRKNYPNDSGTATHAMGDANHDGYIDEYDFDEWRLRFGRVSGSGASAETSSLHSVPEPASLTFVAFVTFAYLGLYRSSRRRELCQ